MSQSVPGASLPSLTNEDYRDQATFRSGLRQFLHFSEEQARAHGITPQQHLLLLVIRGHEAYPAVTIGDAALSLQIRHHSASLLVDRCVRRGLLNRQEDPDDRRRVRLSLTPDGDQVLEQITQANRQELGTLEADMFADSFLRKVRDMAAVAAEK